MIGVIWFFLGVCVGLCIAMALTMGGGDQ